MDTKNYKLIYEGKSSLLKLDLEHLIPFWFEKNRWFEFGNKLWESHWNFMWIRQYFKRRDMGFAAPCETTNSLNIWLDNSQVIDQGNGLGTDQMKKNFVADWDWYLRR